MARNVMTLEQLLHKTRDIKLMNVYDEISSGVVPATGEARQFVRKLNNLIDRGQLCINTTTYRKVYLPTLAKAIQKELACRYCRLSMYREEVAATTIEQIALDLVD